MSNYRRVLCGIAGALLLLYVAEVFWAARMSFRHGSGLCICCMAWNHFPEPYDSIASYLVSVAGFYLLSAAAFGDRVRSRYWFLYLIIAHILAAALVGGLLVCWELFKPDDWNIDG